MARAADHLPIPRGYRGQARVGWCHFMAEQLTLSALRLRAQGYEGVARICAQRARQWDREARRLTLAGERASAQHRAWERQLGANAHKGVDTGIPPETYALHTERLYRDPTPTPIRKGRRPKGGAS